MAGEEVERRLAAIVAAEVADFSRLVSLDEGRVASLAFSPDGMFLAAGGDRDLTFRRCGSSAPSVRSQRRSAIRDQSGVC